MITYQELVQERFLLEIFEGHVSDVVETFVESAHLEPAIKKSAEKVLKTLWPMMSALPEKDLVKHPWDSRGSFEHLLPMVARKMFYAGIQARLIGPGEAVGFTRLEEFGAGYLFGAVGCSMHMEEAVVRRMPQDLRTVNVQERVQGLASRLSNMFGSEMDLQTVAELGSLDERKKYFVNACKACYYAGYVTAG